MTVSVIGASGFVGKSVVKELIEQGYDVLTTYNRNNIGLPNAHQLDIEATAAEIMKKISETDAVIFLAWNGLPNFKGLFHLTKNLSVSISFLDQLISRGTTNITISGTCLEYGLLEGEVDPLATTNPITSYGIAKDALRKILHTTYPACAIKWGRLFYVYGPGQSEKSLLPQLHNALQNGEKSFKMSRGDQLRDFIHVSEVAKQLVGLIPLKKSVCKNIGTGNPITVKSFVEKELIRLNKTIDLELGYYNYPDYEPMSFWAGMK